MRFGSKTVQTEFKTTITPKDISTIVDRSKQLRIEDINFIRQATHEDVHAAYILLALEQFLEERRIPQEFKVDLGS